MWTHGAGVRKIEKKDKCIGTNKCKRLAIRNHAVGVTGRGLDVSTKVSEGKGRL